MLITLIGDGVVAHRRFAQHFLRPWRDPSRVYKCKCGLARVKEDNLNLNSPAWTHVVSRLRVRNINFACVTAFPTHSWLRATLVRERCESKPAKRKRRRCASLQKWILLDTSTSCYHFWGGSIIVTSPGHIKHLENGEPLKSLPFTINEAFVTKTAIRHILH